MRTRDLVISAILIAAGAWFGVWTSNKTGALGGVAFSIENGPWRTTLDAGAKSDPWTRAYVAKTGLLALNSSESIYFIARTDSQGRPLTADASYRVEGNMPAAFGWWSLTAYDPELFLFRSEGAHYSVNSMMASGNGTEGYSISVGPHETPVDWIETQGAGDMTLTLRLYKTPPGVDAEMLSSLVLPSIVRVDGQ